MEQSKQAQDQDAGLLQQLAENIQLGQEALEELLPLARDSALKAEMIAQEREYHRLGVRAKAALGALGQQPPQPGLWPKMRMAMGVRIKTMGDRSSRTLAEMLAEGSAQGVTDCVRARRDYPAACTGAQQLALELEQFQQGAESRWRDFL